MPGKECHEAQTRVITNLQTENLIPATTFSDFEQIAAWIPAGFSPSVGQEKSTLSILGWELFTELKMTMQRKMMQGCPNSRANAYTCSSPQ